MANVGQYLIASSWKYWLLFYFRNNSEILDSIQKRYDGMNWMQTEAVGASGAVFGIIGFNFCISMQLILDRFYYFVDVFRDRQFDPDLYEDEEETMERGNSKYYATKLCLDLLWLFADGVHIYNGCLHRVYLDWQWRKQERAGRSYMTADGGIIGDVTHLSGLISGICLYGVYRFMSRERRKHN